MANIANLRRAALHVTFVVVIAFVTSESMIARAQTSPFEQDVLQGIESGRLSLRNLPGIGQYDLVCLASDFPFWGDTISPYAENCVLRGNVVVFRRADHSCVAVNVDRLPLAVLTGSDWEWQCERNAEDLELIVTERYGSKHLYFSTRGERDGGHQGSQ